MGSGGSTARSENLQLGKVKLADWTEAEVVQLLKVFSSVDRDRSGSIDKAEMAALCRTQGRSADNFEEMDWDGDGKMDKREFFRWYTQSTVEEAKKVFSRYAALFEWEYASGAHKPLGDQTDEELRRILVLFSLFDKDKTGFVDASEISNLAAVLGSAELAEVAKEEGVTAGDVAEVDSMRLKDLQMLLKNHGGKIEVKSFFRWYMNCSEPEAAACYKKHAALFATHPPRDKKLEDWSNEDKAGVNALFSHYDKDQSGTIDGNELANLVAALGLREVTVAEIDSVAGGQKDGVIDHDEFLKWYSSPKALATPRVDEA